MKLFAELGRRKVYKVAAAYLVVGWVLIQVAATVAPQLDLPDWVPRLITFAIALGFPIALILSWLFDAGPAGVRRETAAPVPTSQAVPTAPASASPSADAALAIPAKSIAVLPFADLSPAHDQQYFSDGVAEEILNALVKLEDLKVAGRTSSFSFRDRNEDLRTIGRTLAVAHVLEGSVRKHGDRMRITAQLIRTDNGYHLWSENFDGDLSDIFELQERIARAVASEFDVILHGGQRLVPVATADPEAYRLYLQGSDIFNRRDVAHLAQSVEMLKKAIVLDAGFARAHARLAAVYALQQNYSPEMADTTIENVTREAAAASSLDPELGEPYSAIALAFHSTHRFIESREAIEQALDLQPEDTAVRYWAGALPINVGYVDWGCANLEHALVIDPLYPAAMLWRGIGHVIHGDLRRAESLFRKASDLGLAHAGLGMHEVMAARGQFQEAATQLAHGLVMLAEGLSDEQLAILAQGAYGDAAARARAQELIDRIVAAKPRWLPGAIPYVLLVMGETTRALELGLRLRSITDTLYFTRFWMPSFRPTRGSPEFLAFVRHAGLTTLWDRFGPPDACHRDASGEYVWE
ncbi:MAG: hypothetical protein ABI178_09105 [Rhodanobacter sp.]